MRIHTVGHSTREADEFIELLREGAVGVLIDVRRFPGSRRHPQFGRDALAASLEDAGVEYVHEEALGGRRSSATKDSPNGAWRNASFRAYADYANTPPFRAALERVMQTARTRPVALMCAEAVPWRCHRRIISDHLVASGVEVIHLLAPGRSDPHSLNPEAVVREDGSVVYPERGRQTELFSE